MPINLFNDPLASLKLGADNIIKGYVGNASVFPNVPDETTLTILFVDNTATGSILDSTSSVAFTGIPGSSFSTFNRSVNRTNGTYKITGASISKVGDSGGNVSTSVSGSGNVSRNISISGTLPTTSTTITLTVDSTVGNLIARTGVINVQFSGTPNNAAVNFGFNGTNASWTGGAPTTATITLACSLTNGDGGSQINLNGNTSAAVPPYSSMSKSASITAGTFNGGVGGGFNGSIVFNSVYLYLSVGESSTYQSLSVTRLVW